jgi:hypothetical protein
VNPVFWLDQTAQGDAASVCGSFRGAFTASACEARTAPSSGCRIANGIVGGPVPSFVEVMMMRSSGLVAEASEKPQITSPKLSPVAIDQLVFDA